MKTRKGDLIAALLISAALVSAMLMISGCPTQMPNPDDTTNPGNGGTQDQEYDIILSGEFPNGTVDINPSSRKAKKDTTVSITLRPNPGYEPENLAVYETGSYHVSSLTGYGYNYSFKMPASMVRISVDFVLLATAAINAHDRITVNSSWEEIDHLNELIKKLQRLNPTAGSREQTIITTAVNNLAGTGNSPYWDNSAGNWVNLGLIRTKMRNEDLSKWVALQYPSYPMDKGVENPTYNAPGSNNSSTTNTAVGADRTHLYYVQEDNPAPLPTPDVTKGKGWGITAMFQVTGTTPGYIAFMEPIMETTLTYEVGINPQHFINYKLWLVPCAQYILRPEQNATATVTLQDYTSYTTSGTPPTTAGPPTNAITFSTTANRSSNAFGSEQTLNATYPTQRTGNVGKAISTGSYERLMFVTVSTTTRNIVLNVTDSAGRSVINIADSTMTKTATSAASYIPFSINTTITLPSGATSWLGAFYPESKKYTIRVLPATPPTSIPGSGQ